MLECSGISFAAGSLKVGWAFQVVTEME